MDKAGRVWQAMAALMLCGVTLGVQAKVDDELPNSKKWYIGFGLTSGTFFGAQ